MAWNHELSDHVRALVDVLVWAHAIHGKDKKGNHEQEAEEHPDALSALYVSNVLVSRELMSRLRSARGTSSGGRQYESLRHSVSTLIRQLNSHPT